MYKILLGMLIAFVLAAAFPVITFNIITKANGIFIEAKSQNLDGRPGITEVFEK